MGRELEPALKEHHVYKVQFDSLTYDSEDDIYEQTIYYDGGTIDDSIEVIYDGGGVKQ